MAFAPHHYYQAGNSLIHWRDFGGDGPTMVLIHGLGGSIANWSAVAPRLGESARVVALDLPGFGLSPPAADWRVSTHVEAATQFVAQFSEPVTLVGNSMGGLIAEAVASSRPDLVKALLLVSPATPPILPDPTLHAPTVLRLAAQATPLVGPALTRQLRRRHQPDDLVRFTINQIAHRPGRIPPHIVQELVGLAEVRDRFPWAVDAVPHTARSIAGMWRRRSQFVAMIRAITAPTLVVHGVEDQIISPRSVEWLVSLRSDWELIQMEDTGHIPQLDAPIRFGDTVSPWLAQHLG